MLNQSSHNLTCPPPGVYPSTTQFYHGWGGAAIALYAISSTVLLFNIILFIILIWRFFTKVNRHHVPYLLWVTSLFAFLSFIAFLIIVLPKATEFLGYIYRIYEAIVILKFVHLSILWYGDEESLHRFLGVDPVMKFNTLPVCCCCLCIKSLSVTKNGLIFINVLVKQMVVIQTFAVLMHLVLDYNDIHKDGLSSASPHTWLTLLRTCSQLAGLWGLFLIVQLKRTFNILEGFMYTQKFFLMKAILIIFIYQEIIIDALITYDVITCYYSMGPSSVGAVIKSSLIFFETSFLGLISFLMYFKYPTFQGENTMKLESKIIEGNQYVVRYSIKHLKTLK